MTILSLNASLDIAQVIDFIGLTRRHASCVRSSMNSTPPRPLLRHLSLIVVLKLMALAAIWWFFVRDYRVQVDTDKAVSHVAGPALPGASR